MIRLFTLAFLYLLAAPTISLEAAVKSVCGEDGVTYVSKEDAHAHGVLAIHSGNCGRCSNRQDIQIYNSTKNTLTTTAKLCAYLTLLVGEWAGRRCMKTVNFTDGCRECWMDNIKCDIGSRCLWVCLKSSLKLEPRNLPDGRLNDCLQCDEDVCGPAFLKCAGANRRRSGIRSDIDRPEDEVWEGDDLDRVLDRKKPLADIEGVSGGEPHDMMEL
uniref:Uncharacterized protein n=1 Tax=Tetraselmis sp. GSL018 TaxID=582737 RepID=A0A061RHZ8_9CHLO|mmetsp:Transcript_41451/g.98225  ORF Transcript_41451/g.98225 Transcript_41451/m.98225 type:complete len:215 (+) Transcript_41451:122-766(+)|eukprot:CAMPEP_0177584970 /NCGR_PEP_ID=MMETSP0419_2-20121207/4210_1 /TAXON_ID=582737 /ORGANISM="Tetraselmis sp., Strain GSL018" /LENGTH=214 /DNA_ID=CAMNT_0019074605 /DNA_START=67 /DNA_END=711 /DNA_ORIENTATION=+